MNGYDPMKDDSTSQDTGTSGPAAGRNAHSAGADGRSYTNPDGSHGFVYNAPGGASEIRTRRYRSALIAVSAVLITLLAVSGCFFGTLMAARNLAQANRPTDTEADMSTEADTLGGLLIADDSVASDDMPHDGKNETGMNGDKTQAAVTLDPSVTAPDRATIQKIPPKRQDADADGRPDIVYDERGNVLTSADRADMSVATVVDKVAASVVEITTETLVQSGAIGQYITSGAGSGVIIAEEGFIVTNHHVVAGANTIVVRLNDGRKYPALLVGTDEMTDIAVLWVDAGDHALTVAAMGASYDLVVGEDILAIGNPLGSLGGTVTEGMISATARDITVNGTGMTLLQISAPINPGNSGGGLFNLAGELVGVVNAKMASEEIEGLGFAIPSDTAYAVVCEIIANGYVRGRPSLAITMTEISTWKGNRYVCVNDKTHDTLREGDLILAVNGTAVSSVDEVWAIIRRLSVGDVVELTIYRDRSTLSVKVPLAEERPAA